MKAPFPPTEELIRVLESDAVVHDKALACQQLAVAGKPAAIPALAVLLKDKQLTDYARSALQLMGDPAAAEALRKSLPDLTGGPLSGVMDSLGILRDAAAVPMLSKLTSGTSDESANEALAALGKIASDEAVATLSEALDGKSDVRRRGAFHAALVAAQNLLKDGRADKAKELLAKLAGAEIPDDMKAAVREMAGRASRHRMFDGKSFEGWEGDLKWFRIAEGAVVAGGMSKPIPQNEFLSSSKSYADFELRLRLRLTAGKGNGGIQFRSTRVPNSREMSGYQADAALEYWGGLYDESRRNRFLARPDAAAVAKVLRPDGWNDYTIRCEGPRIQIWLNGMRTVDFTETDETVPREGKIGLQIHSGAPSEAWYKEIEIEEFQPG